MRCAGVLLVASWLGLAEAAPATPPAKPLPTNLTESVEKRLAQIDVAIEGDPELVKILKASDFRLSVGDREVPGLIVDPMCGALALPPPHGEAPRPTPSPQVPAPERVSAVRPSFVLVFDQTHLTLAGRVRSLDMARDIIKGLVVDGTRAAIVSMADRMVTVVRVTSDSVALLAGIEKLRADPGQWSAFSELEDYRVKALGRDIARIAASPAPGDIKCALGHDAAEVYAREEIQEVGRVAARVASTVRVLADERGPKGLLLFADRLRQAGGRYLHEYAGESLCSDLDAGGNSAVGPLMNPGAIALDHLIEQALGPGIHFFTVEGEGLMPPALETYAHWKSLRERDAIDTLVSLAAQTGGEAFLRGAARADFIVEHVVARTSCAFLLSFPPGDLPRDRPLTISVSVDVPGLRVRAQDRIVIESESRRKESRILAAYTDPTGSGDPAVHIGLIPEGCSEGRWHARIQVRVDPRGTPESRYDLGASVVSGDRVVQKLSGALASNRGDRPVVLDSSVEIPTGSFEVVAVAHDTAADEVLSARVAPSWPRPDKGEVAIAPIALVQRSAGTFAIDGAAESSGRIARSDDEPIDPSTSVVLTTVVCRGPKENGALTIERSVDGDATLEFAPMTIAPGDDPCTQVVDVIPVAKVGSQPTDYRVTVRAKDVILATARRTIRPPRVDPK